MEKKSCKPDHIYNLKNPASVLVYKKLMANLGQGSADSAPTDSLRVDNPFSNPQAHGDVSDGAGQPQQAQGEGHERGGDS